MTATSFHEFGTFRKALGLCRIFMLPAVIAFVLMRLEISVPFDIELNGIRLLEGLSRNIFLCVGVLFWAGIYSVLADIVTGRVLVMNLPSFIEGKRLWPAAVVVYVAPFLVHFLFFMLTGNAGLTLEMAVIILCPFLSIYAAHYVFQKKFPGREVLPGKLSLLDALILGSAMVCGLCFELAGAQWAGDPVRALFKFAAAVSCLFVLYYVFYALFSRISALNEASEEKRLILINPPFNGIILGCASVLMRNYPSFFISLRAFTPVDYRVFELNRVLWSDVHACSGALVAISCYTANSGEAYAVARKFREAGSKVIMGGPHAGLFPREALEFCDAVVVGPAEGVWGKVVADYENGSLQSVYQGGCSDPDLDHVHRYLLTMPPEIAMDSLMVTRGCKFRCYFCTHSAILNTQPRSVEDMVALLKHIRTASREVSFHDSNLFADPAYAKALLTAMIPLGMKWHSSASLDIAQSDEMVALLKESGCKSLLVGYEVADSSKEVSRGGKFAIAKNYLRLSWKLKKAGIGINAHFMFGFPTDNWQSLWRLWLFCFRLFPQKTALSFMSPIPGSPYYDDMVKDGKLLDLNWGSYNGYMMVCEHPILRPNVLLRAGFLGVVFLGFFLTTSRWGVCLLVFSVGVCVLLFR